MNVKNNPSDGIFHPDSKIYFSSLDSYLDWYLKGKDIKEIYWVGILTHGSSVISDNDQVESALIYAFEKIGLGVIPVFNYLSAEKEEDILDLPGIVEKYFITKIIHIDGLVHLQMMSAIKEGKGDDLFKQTTEVFKSVNVPVFRPIVSYLQAEEEWLDNSSGVATEIHSAFTTNEMMGMIEPILIGCRDEQRGLLGKIPIIDRINRFTNRVGKWIEMKHTPNHLKKIVLMIHSSPCSGVEATIGSGAGLDVFESLIGIMKALEERGYLINNIPKGGEELRQMIMSRKAYQDFRWTTVESIVAGEGVLYQMPIEGERGYLSFHRELPLQMQNELENTWGKVPGEGMVFEGKIIITGAEFGNVVIMVQPKRGCYGAKCTGEVCKILHDPSCPPAYQYIATYKYIEEVMKAQAIVHVGTGGSLQYLPGKNNALSSNCWPDIVLGNTPNLFVYNVAVGVEGTIAKRRNSAVILDYMPSSFTMDVSKVKLIKLISEYLEIIAVESDQAEIIEMEIQERIQSLPRAQEILRGETEGVRGLEKLKDLLIQSINANRDEKLHVFGKKLSLKEITAYIMESLDGSSSSARTLKNLCQHKYEYQTLLFDLIHHFLCGNSVENKKIEKVPKELIVNLQLEIQEMARSLEYMEEEIICLVNALEGKYVEPGLAGMPCDDIRDILPTGRNLFIMDAQKVPTPEAYLIGMKLAEEMIAQYKEEERKIPEKVAMNMMSMDISMTKGEQVSQILYLMGIRPVWNNNGKVESLEVIPLEELKRPRIDVVVRITGVLRDAYPQVVDLMDQAAVIASNTEESLDKNYIRKNTLQLIQKLKEAREDGNIERRATIRIFGDKPGTYGSGVDLALKASAWREEKDIAKVFTVFSGYAYGNGLNGYTSSREFVENVKDTDISYEKATSKRYDVLSSEFISSVQGGFQTLKKNFSKAQLKQYHGRVEESEIPVISTMAEELKRNLNETVLNPFWNESMMEKGYDGASEIMERIQTVFSWKSLTKHIKDEDLDQMVDFYANDKDMKKWFQKYNPYAFEEICRRFLELHQRDCWNPKPEILENLKKTYMEMEGQMEEVSQEQTGEYQGGNIEVLTHKDIEAWGDKLSLVNALFNI